MDKRELQKLLSQPYRQENWKEIVQFVFPNVSILSTPKEFPINNDKIKKFCQIGNVRLNDGKNLALFELILGDSVNLLRNRVELNNEISKYIDQEQIHGVLSVFEQGGDDYRFTFSARSSEFDEEESDFVQKKTDTKRFTYLLGKNESCKTPADRFYKLSEKKSEADISAIQHAFSIEQLSREFFDKYKKQFDKFWTYINTNKDYETIFFGDDRQKSIRDFTKKLLGRIVFLQFLQKKGWMGCAAKTSAWEDGDKQFMQNLLDAFEDKEHFHSKCLAVLFYNTLNRKRNDDLFVCEGLSSSLNNTKIPYLNGGLFDSDEDESRKIDFPIKYFEELLEFFGQYNFTIDETDPNDHEVGIDPEMLGHIFENLLEDNKDKGAFYTPKVIVQYMCQESLIEYILTKLNSNKIIEIKDAVEDLLRNRLVEKCSDLDLVEPIAQTLYDVKICDPAIGSGAFPMGILNVIYQVVEKLYWIQPDSVARVWNISDTEWQPHRVKQNIMQHSIYGVDLESGAVDIARLRFWLALVVDEVEPLPLPNLDYKIMQGNSLLESFEGIDLSKIGDAAAYQNILDEKNQIDLFTGEVNSSAEISSLEYEDVKTLMNEYFNANDPELKKDLHKRIDDQVFNHIQFTLTQNKKELKSKSKKLEKKLKSDEASVSSWEQKERIRTSSKEAKALGKINLELEKYSAKEISLGRLSNSNERPFFLWHLFFQEIFEQGGFDIIIGNPPYINFENLPKDIDKESLKTYETFTSSGDIYYLFTELALGLAKDNGIVTYIISNKWLRANSGVYLRKFLSKSEYSLRQLFDFNQFMIFENAIVHSNIIIMSKSERDDEGVAFQVKGNFNLNKPLSYHLEKSGVNYDYYDEEIWNVITIDERALKNRIESEFVRLDDLNIEIKYGIKTAYNDAFLIDELTMNELKELDEKNIEIIKPTVRGRDTRRYYYNQSNLYIINSHNGYGSVPRIDVPKDYPDVHNHLLKFEEKAKKRSDKGAHWTNLRNCAYIDKMESPKIIFSEIVSSPQFYYDETGLYPEASTFLIYGDNLKLITALLNSSSCTYLFKQFYSGGALVGKYRYKKSFLLKLPIPINSALKRKEEIESLVDQIQNRIKSGQDYSDLDSSLEIIVEGLYEFDENELALIRSETKS
jgi:adenine-specific DNA-methyltransferase